MDEWIHVDDDLPTDDRKVLICYISYENAEMEIDTDRYQEVGDESTFMTELLFGEVIAWRELPEPFKPILHL
jgi:hypothetical protein